MERITRFRVNVLAAIILLVLGFYAFRIYSLQIIETDGNTSNITTFTTITRVKAARGDILDRNGNVLVGNRASYDLTLNHYVLISANGTNNYLFSLSELCNQLGIEYNENFPISKTRPFSYTLDQYNSTWQGYFQEFLARADLDSDITAPLLMERLREYYRIPQDWTDEQARAVIGLRYELDLRNHTNLAMYVFLSDADDDVRSAILELNIPGLNVEASVVREYHTDYAAHILGYTGKMNAEEWEIYKEQGYSMDADVGKDGLELAFEEYLHGTDGYRVDVVTQDGTLIESHYDPYPQAGNNVEITIDINLQMEMENSLANRMETLMAQEEGDGTDAEGAAAVAMDTRTGQILACASYPTFLLKDMRTKWDEIQAIPHNALFNRALQGTYPPGSTYKMSMVIAAINSHLIDSQTIIEDRGVFNKYEGLSFYCLAYSSSFHTRTHGSINASQALQVSCNYFFYELGDRISLSAMDSTAKGLGLGEPTGVELREQIGTRANRETKKELYGEGTGFYQADQVLAAIGQSDNRFTPLQLCSYTCTLANRGTRYAATFLNRVVSSDYRELVLENHPRPLSTLEISDDAYKAYTEGMLLVTSQSGGTAYSVFRDFPIQVAGKTGTAEASPNGSDNGAFVCYAPFDDPEIAVAIYGEKVGHGSTMATVGKDILARYFDKDEIRDAASTNENQIS